MKYLPWIMGVMWLIARIIAGKFFGIDQAKNFGVLSNILLILILIFLTIYSRYKKVSTERPGFFEDMKECMKPALKYVFAAVLSIGLFYGYLSNDVALIREAYVKSFNEGIMSDENFAKFKTDHPEQAASSREELMSMNKENVERNVSVQARVVGSLLALTFVSLVYSLLAVFFWRAVVKRF